MRQIKFRAWDTEEKRFVEWDELRDTNEFQMGLDNDPIVILEQFTGLLDKNGKEIYEGDIVNGYVVWYCDKTLMWSLPRRDDESLLDSYEIIGNIHENPEKLIERTIDEAR
jgi:hypothetical protein